MAKFSPSTASSLQPVAAFRLIVVCHFPNDLLILAMDDMKSWADDPVVRAYKDHETVLDPCIDKETEQKIAHVLGQDYVPEKNDVLVSECHLCQVTPCLLDQGLYQALEKEYEYLMECDTENVITKKEVRFKLYRMATRWIHGFLGRSNHRELPACVIREIKDWRCLHWLHRHRRQE